MAYPPDKVCASTGQGGSQVIKDLRVDFYAVEQEDASTPFEDVVRMVNDLPNDDARTRDVKDYPVRLQEAHFIGEFIDFDIMKVRIGDAAAKATRAGQITPIEMSNGEGFGEWTACRYHPKTKTLLIHRNQHGTSASSIVQYFEKITGNRRQHQLLPILGRQAWGRFDRLSRITWAEIETSGFGDLDLQAVKNNISAEAMVRAASEFGARKTVMKLGLGQREGSLVHIRNWIRSFFNLPISQDQQITKIRITGIDDGDERRVVDILKDKIVESIQVEVPEGETLGYPARRRALAKAWENRCLEISELRGML